MPHPSPHERSAYRHFLTITTRWMDNDVYGHINNVVYYSYFDTVVNTFLIDKGVLDIEKSTVVGLVVETACNYFSSLVYPKKVVAGMRVAHMGNSSVRYEIGLFEEDSDVAAAQGHFVHVYVERKSQRPTALPAPMREALATLLA